MNDIGFSREISVGKYLDPFDGFKEKEARFEIRKDEITGVTSRILPYRFRVVHKPDLDVYLEKSPEAKCPFCPPRFEQITPRFTPDVIPEGRFRRGNAVLFPNAFPHDKHNGVAIFSSEHFLGLDRLTPDVMIDGFLVCRDYFARMINLYPALRYCSINWNYMPAAGGGMLHPHIQTVIGENPTRFVNTLCESALRRERNTGGNLWDDLVAFEKAQDERFIASTGPVDWLVSFAPKGMAGEIVFLLLERSSVFSLAESDYRTILSGLSRLFGYFLASNIVSFNMALYASLGEDSRFCVQGRIIPRFLILPLGTSDINYFEKLHDEIICPVIPEQVCRDIRPYFADRRD